EITMSSYSRWNSLFAAQVIAAEERHREAREAAHQARLIGESEIAFDKGVDRRLATVRRSVGVALIRAGQRLRGAPAVASRTSPLSGGEARQVAGVPGARHLV